MNRLFIRVVIVALGLNANVSAAEMGDVIVPTKHNKHLTLGTLAKIAPGLGTVMMEYSHRFYVAYYAAKAGNWDLAKYELHEMEEIQEVGEATRPEYAAALKAFERNYLDKVSDTAKAGKWEAFDKSYKQAVIGCNACHTATGHSYIKYKLPSTPPKLLDLSAN